MGNLLSYILSFFILFPVFVFIVTYIVLKRTLSKPKKAMGIAADVTTIFLFIAITISISTLWDFNSTMYVILFAFIIGVIMTVIEWKSKKEIIVVQLLRKIWRLLFLLLNIVYLLIWIGGIVYYIWSYVVLS